MEFVEAAGRLIEKGDVKVVGQKGRQVCDFVVETDGEWPQKLPFAAWGKAAEAVQYLRVGDDVHVTFDVRGHEYNGKYYADLVAFKVKPLTGD